jgi:hypothetical protein
MVNDQVYQDFYEIQRAKEREDTEHGMRIEQVQSHLNVLDQKSAEISQYIMILKSHKQEFQQNIERNRMRLMQQTEIERALDRQVEEILGRAIEGKDLQLLYELDLKTLNQLNSGGNKKFDGYV